MSNRILIDEQFVMIKLFRNIEFCREFYLFIYIQTINFYYHYLINEKISIHTNAVRYINEINFRK